ncbi:uncharacterized protein LOC118373719 [Oncorhynchus keta]|uniref:uncharacterized protein LOC118373719 n=1 Tax=Oncorhynchus keta TaxID=8018 RepID=UPI00227B5F70|nr:uncharacterized protein LOC118373719 [Oncorhynchus keta]
MSFGNSNESLCNFNISEYACSSTTLLSADNLVTILKCQLSSKNTYSTEMWKLFFQNNAAILDQALLDYSSMNPNTSSPAMPNVLDAIGDVKLNNFMNAQLNNASFVDKLFQKMLRPFLASPSRNFLSCLSSKNFSCQTYQIVIEALSNQSASMDRDQQRVIFTHYIYPFLSRNDSSDPGCVSNTSGSMDWLQRNFGIFSVFAELQELQVLNPHFSSKESLSLLTPTQVAQLTLTSGALNDTDDIKLVFTRLEEGDAFKNVDEFLTQLTVKEEIPDIHPAVRDVMMNQTFNIISLQFPEFETLDWIAWFEVKLIPILPSFNEVMLTIATSNVNCTNYQVIVNGMDRAFPEMTQDRREGIARVLLKYLRKSVHLINGPACRQDIHDDNDWLAINLGSYSEYTTYSDLKDFNISGVAVLDSLSPNQKAELILDPSTGALENETLVKNVFISLLDSPREEQLNEFFVTFVEVTKQENITIITNTAVRDTMLDLTLMALAPKFNVFEPKDFQLWFQVNLVVLLASFHPGRLVDIPLNITCESYNAIFTGLDQSLESLPPHFSQGVKSSLVALMKTFQRCSRPPALIVCKETLVNEKQLCAGFNSTQLKQQMSFGNSNESLCNFNISEYACSSTTLLSADNLVTILKCQLSSKKTYSTEMWKLFFQNNAAILDQALLDYSSMNPNTSSPAMPNVLDAIGDVKLNNFTNAQLNNASFVDKLFQKMLRPFLASPSRNFLSCLSSKNFSCQTYQIVIEALSNQSASMDREQQRVIFTHYIYPFLSRNDSSDPGCVSNTSGSMDWLQRNFGIFSVFAELQELQVLNPHFSSKESLSLLTPTQVAQLTLTSGALNDTDDIKLVFTRLEEGDAFKNVDEFLTQLTAKEEIPDIHPAVRDVMMNQTFNIISLQFPEFETLDWIAWFEVKLIPILPSFNEVMLTIATSNVNCTNYQVIVNGMDRAFPEMTQDRREGIARVLLKYLRKSVHLINGPACRQDIHDDNDWLAINLGSYSEYTTYSDLKDFNISGVAVLDSLSPNQKAELILDPSTGALENETLVKNVFISLLESPREEQLNEFFVTFVEVTKQENITIITNTAIRDTMLDLTLMALAPKFDVFEPKDFQLWFQVNLVVLLASFHPGRLVDIPLNITCESYNAIFTGLDQSLESLPPHLSQGVKSSLDALMKTFQRCSRPPALIVCKETLVNEKQLCAGFNSTQLKQQMSFGNSNESLCNFNISEYACSSTTLLSADKLVTILKCQLSSKNTYSTEMWKLFFQNNAAILDQALLDYSSMNPNTSSPAMPNVLDAIGDVKLNNFMNAQLNNASFVDKLFQKMLRPFLASPSRNFLSCLSSKNFSCQTYQIVIEALSNQSASMDREQQRVIFTHYIYPFLSRNDSSDPGCVSNTSGSMDWLQRNFGIFSVFAELQELQVLNPHFSSKESLSLLTPTQVAQLTLTSGALNDTDDIKLVFTRLEEGDAFKNVDEFLTQLTAKEEIPDIHPAVRDVMMNQTFNIISLQFPEFKTLDWIAWFEVKLIPILPSFNEVMLTIATSNVNCTNYQVIVNGMDRAFPEMTQDRREGIARVLLKYLRKSVHLINGPACRQDIHDDNDWLAINLGSYSEYTTYSDLKDFNISGVAVLDSLSPNQKAELILDPSTGALENETLVKNVFISLLDSPREEQLNEFFVTFVEVTKQENITIITNTAVRDTMLDLTLMALAPKFGVFEPKDFQLWFQVNLVVLLASFHPGRLVDIPLNITCESYNAIFTGLDQSLESLPPHLSQGVKSSLVALMKTFQRCSRPPALIVCKETLVNEKQLCAGFNSTQLKQQMSFGNSNESLCNFNISEYACSSTTLLSADNLVTILKCQLSSKNTYSTEMWKLFFQNNAAILDQALLDYSSMNPNTSSPAMPNVLDAIGDVKLNNFMNAQLNNASFVDKLFQKMLRPFLASPSRNFLSCLSSKNFSCQTYQIVIEALSNQSASMDREQQRVIFTHYIYPFLSRNDSSDPGCVSNTSGSMDWLQRNFGIFSVFAELQELQVLNPHFSSKESLSLLTPTQVAQLTLTSGALNDTDDIKLVFTRLEEGDAFKNVDEFLTQLTAKEETPDIHPAVRDVMMNQTFNIISLQFPEFETLDWIAWFEVKLIPILPSFNEVMLIIATSNVNCTNYQVIVRGMDRSFPEMSLGRKEGIARVLLEYLRRSVHLINGPACRQKIHNDADWLAINLGPFSEYATYSDLKVFNISGVAVLDSLSPNQKAELILDPTNLANESLVQEVFLGVLGSSGVAEIGQFFQSFVEVALKRNLTAIEPGLRDTLLNLTLTALAPKLQTLDTLGFKLWFQVYLPLFLPSIHPGTFSVIPRNISCDSYSAIIKGCDNVITRLSLIQSQQVFVFTKDYLTGQSIEGFSCVKTVRDDRDWLGSNFGQFRVYASYVDFVTLKSDFNGVKAADLLTPIQLAQLATIPSQLEGAQDVNKIMAAISPANFGLFLDILSPAIQKHMKNYTAEVKSAFLQVVLDSGNLSSTTINDTQFLVWLRVRLNPLLLNLSSNQVTPLFRIMKDRGCNSSQEAISLLDTLRSTLTKDTQREIYSNTLLLLKEPTPLRCYVNGSLYWFLRSTFLGFGFPDLSMLFTLMPDTRQPELLNSITSSELSQFLSQPDVVGNGSNICAVFNNYAKTPVFLETEEVPDAVKQLTLPCVWSLALNSGNRSEVNAWFDLRLKNYLRFLTRSLVSSSKVQNASCLAFQKLVSVLGSDFSYNSSDFAQSDVYITIKSYLGTGGPRCYSANDPELNSTAWFVNYIGVFVTYLSLEDLNTFVTASQINVFLENQANIKLFNNTAIPANVTSYYITQLYTLNPTFNPLQLPGFFLCEVPSTAYNSLGQTASMEILDRLQLFCNGTKDPQVSAALVANFHTITESTLAAIGNSSSGLTTTQISSISSSALVSSLATLGSVSGWNLGQASAVVQSIITGSFPIDTASSLMSLGTLVAGVPSAAIASIPATELLTASQSSVFITNMLAAPQIVQETYVNKIIAINQSPNALVVNVPDAMATLIPRALLTFSQEPVDVQAINRKAWKQEQAVIFFGDVASNASIDSEELSPSVLQGFTCTSAQSMTIKTVHRLVHACRPRILREKVALKETQLTCMYNLLKDNLDQSFTDYPSDMLLYYNYAKVEKSNCRSYFNAAGSADFSVLSSVLNKDEMLLDNAKSCLGISEVSLSKNHVEVLGNMVCTMNGSYILNSDPFILEKLKNCKDFTEAQVAAMETILISGTTQYGKTTTWNQQTLENLETLPLYLTQNFWSLFTTEVKGKFLKSFMPQLRKQETVKRKLKTLFKQINSFSRSKRGAGCITGNITQSVIADTSFPFGYDMTQFDLCLDISVLKDNLAAFTKQVDDNNFQKIILVKLNQAYPSGIVDEQLKVLGSVSRVATLDDITKWSITKIDTLSALMAFGDGPWETEKSKAIITTYLNTSGNSLGSSELNAVGANLCSLDVSVLKTITSSSLKNANSLDVTSCSTEQKRAVYDISKSSFSSQRITNPTYYQLISPYLGGAPIEDIRSLAAQNVNMDITTFKGLESTVIPSLTVSEVKGILGANVDDLKTFENDTVVHAWLIAQPQSDLDLLRLGLTGGKETSTAVVPTAVVPLNTTNTTLAHNAVTAKPLPITTTQSGVGNGGAHPEKDLGALSLCLALVTVILQMM